MFMLSIRRRCSIGLAQNHVRAFYHGVGLFRTFATGESKQGAQVRPPETIPRNQYFRVSEEVQEAVCRNKPIVALETTIYTHGWPYPDNFELAKHLESIVRSHGGIPATIGILNGVAIVGMTVGEIQELLDPVSKAMKISRRDLSYSVSQKRSGGTTISSTMMLARQAHIDVFATGGLGGVHRGAELSMDISADLTELGRSARPIAVIAGGCKGFLDISRTLEVLETEGAVVATFADGRAGPVNFPAFWVRDSAIRSPLTVKDEIEAANLMHAQIRLQTNSSILLAGPVPETAGISMPEMEGMISHALRIANEQNIHGSANTPFVLNKLKELSKGQSVMANRALVEANVKRGALTAVELSRLLLADGATSMLSSQLYSSQSSPLSLSPPSPSRICGLVQRKSDDIQSDILVAGSIAVDTSATYKPFGISTSTTTPLLQTSNPATIAQSIGGVGYNVALASTLTGSPSLLLSAIASDLPGDLAIDMLKSNGLSTAGIHTLPPSYPARTAQYLAVNDINANLHIAMADMSILESAGPDVLASARPHIDRLAARQQSDGIQRWFIADANWSAEILHSFLSSASSSGLATAFEPVSVAKSARIFDFITRTGQRSSFLPADDDNGGCRRPQLVTLMSPNTMELSAMHRAASRAGMFERKDWWRCVDALGIPSSGLTSVLRRITSAALVDTGIPQQAIQLLPFVPVILVKLGSEGVLMVALLETGDLRLESSLDAAHVVARTQTGFGAIGGLYIRLFQPVEKLSRREVVSVNGAGDTFLGALVSSLVQSKGKASIEDRVDYAQRASVLTLKSIESVSPKLKTLEM